VQKGSDGLGALVAVVTGVRWCAPVPMVPRNPTNARLYAATGDGIARLDEAGADRTVALSLS
jgi:hypothetical protein